MGSLTLPDTGNVYLDSSAVIYSVERIEPYLTLLAPVWQQAEAGRLTLVFSELALAETLVHPLRRNLDLVLVAELARQAALGAALVEHAAPGVEHLEVRELEVFARRRQRGQPRIPCVAQLLLVTHMATVAAPQTIATLPRLRPNVNRP